MRASHLQQVIAHDTLKPITDPLLELRTVLRGKALMRLKYESKDKAPELSNPESRWFKDPEGYAEDLFAYYECFKCKKPYYGARASLSPCAFMNVFLPLSPPPPSPATNGTRECLLTRPCPDFGCWLLKSTHSLPSLRSSTTPLPQCA